MNIAFDPPLVDDRPAQTLWVDVLGSRMRTWIYPARGRARSVILAVHGFRGDHQGLRRIVNALPDHLLVVPDLPGFGHSSPFTAPGAEHTAAGYDAAITAVRDALELPASTLLLGHSFGSVVAADHVAAHPEDFAGLILINPICRPALQTSPSQALSTLVVAGYYRLTDLLPLSLGEALLRARPVVDVTTAAMATTRDPETRRYVRDQHRAYFSAFSDPGTLLQAYRSSIRDSVRDVAADLHVPALLVAGEVDPLGSVQGQRDLAAAMPDARLRVIDGVGHLIHYERPRAAAAAIEEFVADRDPDLTGRWNRPPSP